MLVERDPKLLTVHLDQIGSASSYRAVDFRKPVLRNILRGKLNCHFQDLPVFNGKYSTTCYVDETLHALNEMTRKMGRDAAEYYRELVGDLHASPVSPDARDVVRDELPVRVIAGRRRRARGAREALRAREGIAGRACSPRCARSPRSSIS